METKIISNVNEVARSLIRAYLKKHGITLNKFCVEAKLYQSNIHVFMRGGTISTRTLEKIGKFLEKSI